MKKINDRLEHLSNQIRMGMPVDILEALDVLEYQMKLIKEKEENRLSNKLKRLWKRITNGY